MQYHTADVKSDLGYYTKNWTPDIQKKICWRITSTEGCQEGRLISQTSFELAVQTENSILPSVIILTIPFDILEKVVEHPLDGF